MLFDFSIMRDFAFSLVEFEIFGDDFDGNLDGEFDDDLGGRTSIVSSIDYQIYELANQTTDIIIWHLFDSNVGRSSNRLLRSFTQFVNC